jgi:hypothetical protein
MGALFWSASAVAAYEQQTYESVDAQVVEVVKKDGAFDRLSNNCSTGDDRGARQVYVTYRYEVDGAFYTSKRYDAQHDGELFCAEEPALARVEERKSGIVTAHYDPADPSRAVLQKEDPTESYVVLTVFAVSGVILLGLFVRQVRRYGRWRRHRGVV